MVALGMAGFVIGFVLGLRFKVFILLPVEMIAAMSAVFVGASGEVGWLTAFLGFTVFMVSSQFAYAVSLAVPVILRAELA